MQHYRFSPIQDETQMMEAIKYIHFACHALCMKLMGKYLPVAGNVGVFCHYDDEFKKLTKIRKNLTDLSDNWNQKYFRLHQPIVIPAKNKIPITTYTYLYIRKPDLSHPQVGDADFYLKPKKYNTLKQSLLSGKKIKGVRIFERPDLDLIELYGSDSDVCAFVGRKTMDENISFK